MNDEINKLHSINKIKAYFFMNAVFEDNGTCLVLLSFLQEE